MSEPVNLNRFRKNKARAEAKVRADRNAIKFGRTGAEKAIEKQTNTKAKKDLEGHKREP